MIAIRSEASPHAISLTLGHLTARTTGGPGSISLARTTGMGPLYGPGSGVRRSSGTCDLSAPRDAVTWGVVVCLDRACRVREECVMCSVLSHTSWACLWHC
ncbi:hypothetical protein GCM10009642_44680 [Nocardiopsis metallicus]